LVDVRGAGLSSQLEGRGEGCHRLLYSLSANLIFSSDISMSYPSGKGLDKGEAFGLGEVGEVWVSVSTEGVDEFAPIGPKLCPIVVGLSHDPMGCLSSRSSEKTKEVSLSGRVYMCQEASCVRANLELKWCERAASVRSYVPLPALREDLLARSAMLLLRPAMCHGASGEHCLVTCRSAKARTRRCPTKDCLEDILRAHETAEVLSTQAAACLLVRSGMRFSKTRY